MSWTCCNRRGPQVNKRLKISLFVVCMVLNSFFCLHFVQRRYGTTTHAAPLTAPPFATPLEKLESMTLIDLFNHYMKNITTTTYTCKSMVRYGDAVDGGWEICQDAAYQVQAPCLIYSMGINGDFSFDDAVSQQLGCQVHSFDPSMNVESHDRSDLVHFHDYGLKGREENGKQFIDQTKFKLKNYQQVLQELGHEEKTIDYFKMDIEGPEWKSMKMMLEENLMQNVRQFSWEFHVWSFDFTKEKFIEAIQLLENLRAAGFEMYLSHENPRGYYDNDVKKLSCCYELYYVNTKYVKGKND